MPFEKIVLLAGKWNTTPIVYNFMQSHFGIAGTIVEESVPKKIFLQKRIKKIGLIKVGGQVLFQLLIAKPLGIFSKKRVQQILDHYNLSDQAIPAGSAIQVGSVNSDECLRQLIALQPDLIIVHGTRIISKRILNAIDVPFINIHAGITPRYRGSHGAYWALANNDPENCGVTVHLVDTGIDTGNILAQCKIPYIKEDNFSTYPYLQLAEGLQLLKHIIPQLENGEKQALDNKLNSSLWHHPTIWGYLANRLKKGVK